MRTFSHVKLAYDVFMRRNIPAYILFTSLTNEQHTILIIKYCLTGCNIGRAFFGVGNKSVFKRLIQVALKFQGLKDLGHGPLSNCQKFTCPQFVGGIYEKLDPTSLNEVSCAKAATKLLSTDNSFHLHILHSTHPTHKMIMDKRQLNTLMAHIEYASYDDESFNSCSKAFK